jgi:hypothetical protein
MTVTRETARPGRESRTQNLREADQVHESYDDNWEAPTLLDTSNIPARDGYVQRWVRTKLRGEDDQNNIFRKINYGWKPRSLDSVPKGQFVPQVNLNGENVIGIHGMILMERPKALHDRQAAFNRKQADNQITAAKHNLFRVHNPGDERLISAPSMKMDSTVSRGRLVESDDD